jgi:hypothetical protein
MYFKKIVDLPFSTDSCFIIYPSHYKMAFAFSEILIATTPTGCLTVTLPPRGSGEGIAFPRSTYVTIEYLRWISYADGSWFPYRHVIDL